MASAITPPSSGDSSKKTRDPVELYLVRIYPPCRAVWLYLLQNQIPHKLIDVDFTNGVENIPDFLQDNPHREVPILVDGDIVVFEGQAILRYLATEYTSYKGYGPNLATRYLCESLISWASSELHRVVGYRYTYPQFLEKFRLSTESSNEALIESGIKQLTQHLETLERRYLDKHRFLCGDKITIADSYIATILVQVEWVGFKFSMWPRIEDWIKRVKRQDFWNDVHAVHNAFVTELDGANFVFD